MSEALEGEHYCSAHQGNHSHYAPHNCRVCTLEAQKNELAEQLSELLHSYTGTYTAAKHTCELGLGLPFPANAPARIEAAERLLSGVYKMDTPTSAVDDGGGTGYTASLEVEDGMARLTVDDESISMPAHIFERLALDYVNGLPRRM